MQKNILKGSTLLLFFSLIIVFVTFRSGFFGDSNTSYPSSPNGSALNNQTDSITQIESMEDIEMMHSSKVLIIRELSLPDKSDSSRINIDSLIADSTFKINPLIYSSKSAIIMEPQDLKLFKFDSLKIDTPKTK